MNHRLCTCAHRTNTRADGQTDAHSAACKHTLHTCHNKELLASRQRNVQADHTSDALSLDGALRCIISLKEHLKWFAVQGGPFAPQSYTIIINKGGLQVPWQAKTHTQPKGETGCDLPPPPPSRVLLAERGKRRNMSGTKMPQTQWFETTKLVGIKNRMHEAKRRWLSLDFLLYLIFIFSHRIQFA